MSPHSTVFGSEDRWKKTKQSNMGITWNNIQQNKSSTRFFIPSFLTSLSKQNQGWFEMCQSGDGPKF